MSRPWVKTPVDIDELLGLDRLDPRQERTFWRLFTLARREPPHLGYVTDLAGRVLSQRALSNRLRTPRSTLQGHLDRLHDQALLARDMAGRYLLPIVIEIEHRFRSPKPTPDGTTNSTNGTAIGTTNGTTNGTTGRAVQTVLVAVENQPAVRGSPGRGGRESGEKPPIVGHPLLIGSSENEITALDLGPSASPKPVENPFADPDISYLIGKLAHRSSLWLELEADAGERSWIEGVYRQDRPTLLAVLAQAVEQREPIRTPGRWVARTFQRCREQAQMSAAEGQ